MPPRNARARDARESQRRTRAYAARQTVYAEQRRRHRRDTLLGIVVGLVAVGVAVTGQVLWFTAGPGAPKPVPSASATVAPSTTATPATSSPTPTTGASASSGTSPSTSSSASPSPSASG